MNATNVDSREGTPGIARLLKPAGLGLLVSAIIVPVMILVDLRMSEMKRRIDVLEMANLNSEEKIMQVRQEAFELFTEKAESLKEEFRNPTPLLLLFNHRPGPEKPIAKTVDEIREYLKDIMQYCDIVMGEGEEVSILRVLRRVESRIGDLREDSLRNAVEAADARRSLEKQKIENARLIEVLRKHGLEYENQSSNGK